MKKLSIVAVVLLAVALPIAGFLFRAQEAKAQVPNTAQVTPLAISAVGAAQSNAATLPATAGKTTFITGFDVTAGGATAASVVEVSITGLPSAVGTLKFEVPVAAGVAAPMIANVPVYSIRFPQPIPASALNTTIVVTLPSLGAGNTNASVTAYGFQF